MSISTLLFGFSNNNVLNFEKRCLNQLKKFFKVLKIKDVSFLVKKPTDLHDMLKICLDEYQDSIAFSFGNKQISYRQFYYDVANFASSNLEKFKNKNVLMIGDSSYRWAVCYFSVVISAGVAILASQRVIDNITSLVRTYDVSTVVDLSCKCKPLDDMDFLSFVDIKTQTNISEDFFVPSLDPDQVCTILFTSEETEKNKGIMLSHKNLCCSAFAGGIETRFCKKGEIYLNVLPFFHAYGLIGSLLAPFLGGGKTHFGRRIQKIFTDLPSVKPTSLSLVPKTVYTILSRLEQNSNNPNEITGGRLKRIICESTGLKEGVVEKFRKFGIWLAEGYGISEYSWVVCVNGKENFKDGSLGQPISCNKVKIAEESSEILVKGDNVMCGYHDDPEITKKVIKDGWFHTGDTGFIDSDGFLYFTGKIENLIVLEDGKKVNPEELEKILEANQEIDECLIYGNNENGKVMITAKIYAKNRRSDLCEVVGQIIASKNRNLPAFKRVMRFELLNKPLEKTAFGKYERDLEILINRQII
ncbi:hypothetical protein FACS189481_4420 [Clostridia bacterium]|nr:hypothetical protein FACS189481_4420 [Clostridia bacterium]